MSKDTLYRTEPEIDHRYTDTVICPYCGKDNGGDDGDGPPTGEQQCYECEKKFDCEPDFSVSYTTHKVPCWNGEPHHWREWANHVTWLVRSCRACGKHDQVRLPVLEAAPA